MCVFLPREGRLSPAAVNTEVDLLKTFCGTGENRVLKSVSYTSGLHYPHFPPSPSLLLTLSLSVTHSLPDLFSPSIWLILFLSYIFLPHSLFLSLSWCWERVIIVFSGMNESCSIGLKLYSNLVIGKNGQTWLQMLDWCLVNSIFFSCFPVPIYTVNILEKQNFIRN